PVSFQVQSGEFFAIVGPSGCGKSTVLNLLAGLERPDTGQVLADGVEIAEPGPDRAMVFPESGLMPWMTVRGNVEYGLRLKGLGKAERREKAMEFLRKVHLSKYADSLPHQLSGGMSQRASIARALALEPRVLLMDEPFSALDAQTRDLLQEELERLWLGSGMTVLFVTHNLSEAVYLADRVMIMTAPPGSIKALVHVPFAHPRSRLSVGLAEFTTRLRGEIREEVDKVAARELDADWQPGMGESELGVGSESGGGI
ncbi:MAG: ABC transporter ATP-binding protein, partial [bacterium]